MGLERNQATETGVSHRPKPAGERGAPSQPGRASQSLAIILPAYNEELTIATTIRAFHAAIPEARIVVVNNNSTDGTADLARATLDSLGCLSAFVDEPRQGKGNAVRRAFHDVDADIYVLVDADMTYPANRVRDLIEPIATDRADMVVGDRLGGGHYQRENKRPFHNFGNRLVLGIVNLLFRSDLSDIMSGYRAFSADFVQSYPILVGGFEIETDMTLHALDKRFRVTESRWSTSTDRPEAHRSSTRSAMASACFGPSAALLDTIGRCCSSGPSPSCSFSSGCYAACR